MVRPYAMKGQKRKKKKEEKYDRAKEEEEKEEVEEEESNETGKRTKLEKTTQNDDKKGEEEQEDFVIHEMEGIPVAPSDRNTKRPDVIFVLEKASLEVAKVGKSYQILSSDDHANFLRRNNKNPAEYRPDIVHQMAPGTRSRAQMTSPPAEEAPTPADQEAATSSVGSQPQLRASRGPIRGLGVAATVRSHGRIPITIDPVTLEQVGGHNTKLITSCGTLVRTRAPIGAKSWSKIPDDVRMDIFRCLLEWFDLDLESEHVRRYLNKIMSERYSDYRFRLHHAYKKLPPHEARSKPPKNVNADDWNSLCDIFENDDYEAKCQKNVENRSKLPFNHRGGSKPFIAHREQASESGEVQSFSDFFHATHYNEKHGWISSEAQSAHDQMVELQQASQASGSAPISDEAMSQQVFGDQTRYYRGLAKQRHRPRDQSSSSINEGLRDRLATAEEKLHATESRLETTESELHTTRSELHTTQSELHTTRSELHTYQSELHTTQSELQEAKGTIGSMSDQLNRVTSFLSILHPDKFPPQPPS